jgi:hypothetical protein
MPNLKYYLETNLGIDRNVIESLCNREVPANNEYWKGRTSFLSQSPGYLFIPILLDLFLKSDLDPCVLSESHLLLIEDILNSAARQEAQKITYVQHHEECKTILHRFGISDQEILKIEQGLVKRPFRLFPSKFKSLQRANTYLYSGALFPNDYDLIFHVWECVMPLFLFMDDLTDLSEDIVIQSENCLLDSDDVENSFFILHPLMAESIKPLEKINDCLYEELNQMRQEAIAATLKGMLLSGNKHK